MQSVECLAVIHVRARPDEVNRSGPLRSSAQGARRPCLASPRHLHWKSVRHRQCAELICFQGNLLSKHDIARDQITCGHETPANDRTTIADDLVDVRRAAGAYAAPLAALATDHIEISLA